MKGSVDELTRLGFRHLIEARLNPKTLNPMTTLDMASNCGMFYADRLLPFVPKKMGNGNPILQYH